MGRKVTDRRERLKAMIEARPEEAFPRYGLAMEHKGAGELEEALPLFQELLELHPGYLPAYYHFGTTLRALEDHERAREVYQKGIRVAEEKGETHAREELQEALEELTG